MHSAWKAPKKPPPGTADSPYSETVVNITQHASPEECTVALTTETQLDLTSGLTETQLDQTSGPEVVKLVTPYYRQPDYYSTLTPNNEIKESGQQPLKARVLPTKG